MLSSPAARVISGSRYNLFSNEQPVLDMAKLPYDGEVWIEYSEVDRKAGVGGGSAGLLPGAASRVGHLVWARGPIIEIQGVWEHDYNKLTEHPIVFQYSNEPDVHLSVPYIVETGSIRNVREAILGLVVDEGKLPEYDHMLKRVGLRFVANEWFPQRAADLANNPDSWSDIGYKTARRWANAMGHQIKESAGDIGMVACTLALMTGGFTEGTERASPPGRWLYRGHSRAYMSATSLIVRVPRHHTVFDALKVAGIEYAKKRAHEVMGHWRHYAGDLECEHKWEMINPVKKHCTACEMRATWVVPHMRGSAEIGFVTHTSNKVEADAS